MELNLYGIAKKVLPQTKKLSKKILKLQKKIRNTKAPSDFLLKGTIKAFDTTASNAHREMLSITAMVNDTVNEFVKTEGYNKDLIYLLLLNNKDFELDIPDDIKRGVGYGKDYWFEGYDIDEYDLLLLARACKQENGSKEGMMAEMSLILNKYEMDGAKEKGMSIVEYMRNADWWASDTFDAMENDDVFDSKKDKKKALKYVEDVLKGKRTLPPYVDEHDCSSDIKCAKNDDVEIEYIDDRDEYIKDKTDVENDYNSTYKFYCFPDGKSDLFGYTKESTDKYEKMLKDKEKELKNYKPKNSK